MKKITLLIGVMLTLHTLLFGQNGLIGSGFGADDWSTISNFSESAGTSRILTTNPNGIGDRYFRLVVNWDGNYSQYGPSNSTTDYSISPNIIIPSTEIVLNNTSKSYYINVSNANNNYVFKTRAGGNLPNSLGLIIFTVGGDIVSANAINHSPINVSRGQDVVVSTTLTNTLSSGQSVYLRYTNSSFENSTVVEMTGTGTTRSAIIPSSTNTVGSTIRYYVFTSGDGLTINSSDADFYTINLLNNNGNNYSYVVSDSYTTKANGAWAETSTWWDNIPPSNSNVTIGHSITLNTDATISSLTINSGATFTASDATARTLTIAKSNAGSSVTLVNNGTWNNGDGGSTVVFTGAPSSGDAIHSITGTIPFQKVLINKTGGTSNVGAGFGSNSSVSESLEIGNGGFVSTDPPTSFYGSSAVLRFNTAGTYNVGASDRTWSTTVIPNSITINSGTVNLNSNRTASGTVIVESGASLVVSASQTLTLSGHLTINGTLTNNGTLTLKSDATGTATMLNSGTVSGSGTYNVEQYLADARNWYVSSPLTAATVPASGYTIHRRNEAAATWDPVSSGTFTPGLGYVALPTAAGATLTFSGGTINTGDVPVALTKSGASSNGFNLIGNPYSAHLAWTQSFTETNESLIEPSIWVRTNAGAANNSGQWSFQTYNATTGLAVPGHSLLGSGVIPPMQAFWVKTKTGGTLTLNSTLTRSHETGNLLKAPKVEPMPKVRLQMSNGVYTDELLLYFNENATDGFDAYDSRKMFINNTVSEFYSVAGNEKLVINGMPQLLDNTVVPLGLNIASTGNYVVRASEISNIPANMEIVLRNSDSNEEFDLRNSEGKTLTLSQGNDISHYSLVFKVAGGTTEVKMPTADKWQIDRLENNVFAARIFNANNVSSRLIVYNALGQKLQDISFSTASVDFALPAQGVYHVKLIANGRESVKSIVY